MEYPLHVSPSALHDVHVITTTPQGQLTSVMNDSGQALSSLCVPCNLDNSFDNRTTLLVQMQGVSTFHVRAVTNGSDKLSRLLVCQDVFEDAKYRAMPFSNSSFLSANDNYDEIPV